MNVFHVLKGYDIEVDGFSSHAPARRTALRLLSAMAAAPALDAASQSQTGITPVKPDAPEEVRLPNGKLQRDEILKADYEKNVLDARNLMDLSKSFELELEKTGASVLSLDLLKKLDDMEKITKRIRGRMRR